MLLLPLKHLQMLHFKPQDLEHLRDHDGYQCEMYIWFTKERLPPPPNTYTIMAQSLIPRPLWVGGGLSQIPRWTVSIEEQICCRWSPGGNRIAQPRHPPSFWALLAEPSLGESCSQPSPLRALPEHHRGAQHGGVCISCAAHVCMSL